MTALPRDRCSCLTCGAASKLANMNPEQSGDGMEWGCGEKQAYQQVSLRNVRVPRQRMRIQSQGLA